MLISAVDSMCKPKIFVSAYACEPGLGSEIGVGWHWVLEMSKYFDLWVLTRSSNRSSIEEWIAENGSHDNVHFLYYDLPKWARFWKKGLRGVRLYYNLWQLCSNKIVKRTMIANGINIFHHLTYGNALWRVSSYGKKQFFIWGPVGGLESIPAEFSKHYGLKSRLIEFARRVVVRLSPLNIGFIRRCKNADLILCKTGFTLNSIPHKYASKALLFTDVAADIVSSDASREINDSGVVEYIAVGRLDAWRGFDLIIEAFALAARSVKNIHLTIVGAGSDGKRLKQLVNDLQIDDIVGFTGKVPMSEYFSLMRSSDVVINAALKEGAVTVSFDAVALGKPLICIDSTGHTRYFNNDFSVIIPRDSRPAVIDNLKSAILRLTDTNERNALGSKAMLASKSFSWSIHGQQIRDVILNAVSAVK